MREGEEEGHSKSFKCSCFEPFCSCFCLLSTYSLPLGLRFQIGISLGGMFWPTYFVLRIYLANFGCNSCVLLSQSFPCHLLSCLPPSPLPCVRHKPPAGVGHLRTKLSAACIGLVLAGGRGWRQSSPIFPLCCSLTSAACPHLPEFLPLQRKSRVPGVPKVRDETKTGDLKIPNALIMSF